MRWNLFGRRRPRPIRSNQKRSLQLEVLEDRTVPSTLVALNDKNQLLTFDSAAPGNVTLRVDVTGLQPRENLVAIDFNPSTGQLFGIGTTSRIYQLNRTTGAAVQVGNVPFDVELEGKYFGTDFNPTNGQLRVVSKLAQNFRVNPATGQLIDGNATVGGIQPDTDLTYATTDVHAGRPARIVPLAYNNNTPDAVQSTLFAIDPRLNVLVRVGGVNGSPDPSSGQVTTIGDLGRNVTVISGIDIAANGVAFGAFTTPILHGPGLKPSILGTINLASGTVTKVGEIGKKDFVLDLAVVSRDETVFALAGDGKLISFNSGNPATILSSVTITGLQAGETIATIDFRPADGKLYGVSDGGRLYVLNTATGAATQVGTGTFTPALEGTRFAADFDAGADRLRVVSNTGQNLRIDPTTGLVANATADADLVFGASDANVSEVPHVVASAYDASFTGTTGSTLFNVDSELDILVRQGSVQGTPTLPNAGELTTIGALGVNVTNNAGMDFAAGPLGTGLAAFQVEGEDFSRLYRINTATGAATEIGRIGGSTTGLVKDIAIAPPQIQFTRSALAKGEGHGQVTVVITRTGGFNAAMAVTVKSANLTATAGQDFGAIDQLVTFQIGETRKTITVPLIDDTLEEGDETFRLVLSNPTNGGQLGANSTITVTIRDNDAPALG